MRTCESNRVADVQELGNQVKLRHVRLEDNPADSLSRGQLPSEFVNNAFWTSGSKSLTLAETEWPQSVEPAPSEMPGFTKSTCLLTTSSCGDIYDRFSSFELFKRVIVYCPALERVEI